MNLPSPKQGWKEKLSHDAAKAGVDIFYLMLVAANIICSLVIALIVLTLGSKVLALSVGIWLYIVSSVASQLLKKKMLDFFVPEKPKE